MTRPHLRSVPTAQVCRTYSLLSTPRSGSTFLCDLLTRTGQLGHPTEHLKAEIAHRLAATGGSLGEVLGELRASTATPNHVFGTKIIIDDLFAFLQSMPRQTIAELRRGPVFVLQRGDKEAQAFSCVRSDVTAIYHVHSDEQARRAAALPFDPDFDAVLLKERWILRQEADLLDILADHAIVPKILSFESLAQSRRSAMAVLAEIAAACVVEIPPAPSWPHLVRIGMTSHVAELMRYRAFRAGVTLYSARSEPSLEPVLRSGWGNPERWGVRSQGPEAVVLFPGAPAFFELLVVAPYAGSTRLRVNGTDVDLGAGGGAPRRLIGRFPDGAERAVRIEIDAGALALEEAVALGAPPASWAAPLATRPVAVLP